MTVARLRPLAETDLIERTRYDRDEGGEQLGGRFFDTAVVPLRAIEQVPWAGSPRTGELCEIPGLRVRRIARFPCGWFSFVHADHLDVVRLLADAQDLSAMLADLEHE